MKEFMVVCKTDCNETCAAFFDTLEEAENNRRNAECGLGWYAEVYRRFKDVDGIDEYRLLYA